MLWMGRHNGAPTLCRSGARGERRLGDGRRRLGVCGGGGEDAEHSAFDELRLVVLEKVSIEGDRLAVGVVNDLDGGAVGGGFAEDGDQVGSGPGGVGADGYDEAGDGFARFVDFGAGDGDTGG